MHGTYDFGAFHLDTAEHLLLRDGRPVPLPPKAFDLLVDLVEHAGHLREKKQLMDALWPGTFVEEVNLAYTVSALRKALGDTREKPEFIETVPTKGYRFVAKVAHATAVPDGAGAHPPPGSSAAVGEVGTHHVPWWRQPRMWVAGSLVTAVALFVWAAASWSTGGHDVASSSPARGLTRFTFDEGLQIDAAWSPNGKAIAYASDASGNLDIWVQRLDGGPAIQLTRTPDQERHPSWSPDGRNIVYRSERDGGGLFVTPSTGGPAHRITTFGTRPRWSPDGSLVVFWSTAGVPGVTPTLYTVSPTGGEPQPVSSTIFGGLEYVSAAEWAPDGRLSLLGCWPGNAGCTIRTSALSGKHVSVISLPTELENAAGFRWAAGADGLFVEQGDLAAMASVWRVRLDAARASVVASERLTVGDGVSPDISPSPDGHRVAFTMSRRPVGVWAFGTDSTQSRIALPGRLLTAPDIWPGSWDLSPDGNRVAHQRISKGRWWSELWITDVESRRSTKLTSAVEGQQRHMPQWSADGSMLAYRWWHQIKDHDGEVAVAIRHADRDDERVLTTPVRLDEQHDVAPYDWTPDGKAVLAGVPSGSMGMSLVLLPVAGAPAAERRMKVVSPVQGFNLFEGQFSPDGRWIACVAVERATPERESDHAAIAIMPAAGASSTGWHRIQFDDWVDKPRWSPRGDALYFMRRQGGFFNLWAAPFDTASGTVGAPTQITHFDSPRFQLLPEVINGEVGVAPGRIVLTIAERTGSIWILDNVDR